MSDEARLVYGKNDIDRVVSVEIDDDITYLYRELEDGSVKCETTENKFWILAHEKINSSWVRMKGNLYYKWGKQYSNRKDFLSDRQRLKKQDIYSVYDPRESLMLKDGITYFSNMTPKDVSILSFDIESYGLMSNPHKEIYMISNTFRRNGKITKKLFSVDNYYSELSMLEAWMSWINDMNPSVITGHNIFGYDLPYIKAVCNKYHLPMNLGRDGSEVVFDRYESTYRVDGSTSWDYVGCNIHGREIIDTMFLSVKYDIGRNFPTWGLKPIINYLGLEKEGREFYDASKIKDNWSNPEEREKIKKYGEDDSDDALALYDLMIPSFFYTAQSIPRPFQKMINSATGGWINGLMVRAYLQDQHSIAKASERQRIYGGISFGVPGVYKNVFKVDVKSMYPSIISAYNIQPTGKDPNGYFLTMCRTFTKDRYRLKDLYKETGDINYDFMQNAKKQMINSFFGFLSTSGLNFNSFPDADKITGIGRQIIRKCIKWATNNTKDVGDYMEYDYEKDKLYDGML